MNLETLMQISENIQVIENFPKQGIIFRNISTLMKNLDLFKKSIEYMGLMIKSSTNVKIDAYDYTVYGALKGKLIFISPDTISEDLKQGEQAYYRIQVQTEGKKFTGRPEQNLEIQPGMTATVEIKIGENTILKYLMKPVIKTLNESLGEK